jgi:hypothetical protein
MKNLIHLNQIFLFVLISMIFISCATQKEKDLRISMVDSLIKNNDFKFVAQQANPLRGGLISQRLTQLDGSYYLKISKDSINCYLPYFGVAQTAPYGSTDNGIQFISTVFTYDKASKEKGSYQITIIPKNTEKANRLFLSISESGMATLNVNSNYRDPISFTGNIEKR